MALTAKKVYAILNGKISEVSGDVSSLGTALQYKGTVATANALPTSPSIGDTYNIESKSVYGEAGMNVAWNGSEWDALGAAIDTSLLVAKADIVDGLTSTDTDKPLSANQGKVLKQAIEDSKYTLPTATATTLGGVKVDTALSGTSTNPVQNKAVKAAVDLKMDKAITDSVTSLKYEIGLEDGIMIFTEVE